MTIVHKLTSIAMLAMFLLPSSTALALGPCLVPEIAQGDAYLDARTVIIKAGFQTPTLPGYGYSEGDEKVISNCFNSVEFCNRFPEFEACSGQGQCRLGFRNAYGDAFIVYTYGNIELDGELTGFEIQCKPTPDIGDEGAFVN